VSESLAQEMRPFNVRVVIVEPGVIATPITARTPAPTAESLYPFRKRLMATFAASRAKPIPPSVVGEAIRDIVASDSLQLRYLVGPDAELWIRRALTRRTSRWFCKETRATPNSPNG
jgi:NAD(P)-dependent dehydrogenase (short-subunit alcohol dehydrogenase family)